ncbi:sporulation protein [Salinactinospora qingdaonensis]
MVFKRLLAAFGVGGPSVDTVLVNPHVRPGMPLEGHVELVGGDHDTEIEEIVLALLTRVEVEVGEEEAEPLVEFARIPVAGPLELAAEERRSIPFSYMVPWQAPLTEAGGDTLPGVGAALRTEVAIDGALDKSDLDPVFVYPLLAQDRILEGFARLGFVVKHAGVEAGHLPGTAQELPFFQEIEFHPAPRYAHQFEEIEVSFIADAEGMDVVLEFDKRGGMFSEGHDLAGCFRITHSEAETVDWTTQLDVWLHEALERHHLLFGGHYDHGGHHEHEEHEEDGGGWGGVVAGAAAGVAAGVIASEVVDAFDDDEEELEEELEEQEEELEELEEEVEEE